MTKDIIRIEGCDGYFCDVVFVTGMYINGVRRDEFPRHIHWLLRPVRHYTYNSRPHSKRMKKYRREISILMMNIGNFYNCVDELYGCLHCGALMLPREFKDDFNMMMEGYWVEGQNIKYLPEKFVLEEEYTPDINENGEIRFSIVRIKPQGISYLKQKFGSEQKFERIIRLMEMMGRQKEDGIDFNRYINKWAKKLLKETKIFENENAESKRT